MWGWRLVATAVGTVVAGVGTLTSYVVGKQLQNSCLDIANSIRGLLNASLGQLSIRSNAILTDSLVKTLTQSVANGVPGVIEVPVTVGNFSVPLNLAQIGNTVGGAVGELLSGAPMINIPVSQLSIPFSIDTSLFVSGVNESISSIAGQLSNTVLSIPLPSALSVISDSTQSAIGSLLNYFPTVCLNGPLVAGAFLSITFGALIGLGIYSCCHSDQHGYYGPIPSSRP